MIDDIVHGRLHPGSKLRIDQLKRRYKMGASPLREALTRMVALGFVTNEARKGFQVSNMSHEDIQDITQVRKLFETRALEISIANGGKDWEEQVVIQMARLRHAVRRNSAGYDPLDAASDRIHRDYHRALISGCGSPRLLELQDTYYDLAKRYRVLVFQSLATPAEFLERHEILTDIVLSKKVGEACGELGRHLDLIVSTLPGLSGDIVVHGPGQVKPRKPKAQSLAS
jgi:DNA-binding GntR family transcriptional regulator